MKKTIMLVLVLILIGVPLVSASFLDWFNGLFSTGAILQSQCNRCSTNQAVINNDKILCENTYDYACSVSESGGNYCLTCVEGGTTAKLPCTWSSSPTKDECQALVVDYYGAKKYDCAPFKIMDCFDDISQGFCLDSSNVCIYVASKDEYDDYGCVKPSYSNLWLSSSECTDNLETKITCYTDCIDGSYEPKIVTATHCSDKGLRSLPPSNCIPPDAEGCSYEGTNYDAGDVFCYQSNVGKCMGNEVIDIVEVCPNGCKNSECDTIEPIFVFCYKCDGDILDTQLIGGTVCPSGYQKEPITSCGEEPPLCLSKESIFYSGGFATIEKDKWGIFSQTSSGDLTKINSKKIDDAIPGFSDKYYETGDNPCCSGLEPDIVTERTTSFESDTIPGIANVLLLFLGLGDLGEKNIDITYNVYKCVGEDEVKKDFCYDWIVSIGESLGADKNACGVGWGISALGAIIAMLLLQRIFGGK